jgi:amidase
MTPIWQWSAVDTAAAIRNGETTSEAVTSAHIARMREVNPALNAVVVDLSDEALKAARAADEALAKGSEVGPLHGVPVTIKINIDVEGQANSNGVVAYRNNIAPGDSPVTANLKKAGAVILGLTNTPEFSLRAFTENPLHGLTRNPWNPDVTCGGSSGGAGASIAAGVGAIAHGNDIGGSLRWPAHCNGVSTIKPTQGRIPAFNPSATAERPLMAQFMSSQGPLAREVRDVRLGLDVMSRRDPRDPWWVPAPLVGPKPAAPIKVALAKIPGDMDTDPKVTAMLRKAADHLAEAGYAVSEVELPHLNATWDLWLHLIVSEIRVLQQEAMEAAASPDFRKAFDGLLALSPGLDLAGYMKGISERSRHIRDWMMFLEEYPLALTPTTVRRTPAVNADLGGDQASRDIFHNDMRFISAINVLGLPAAVTPVGLVDGLPVGVQIVGSRYREDLCLDAAEAIESRVGVLAKQLWARG